MTTGLSQGKTMLLFEGHAYASWAFEGLRSLEIASKVMVMVAHIQGHYRWRINKIDNEQLEQNGIVLADLALVMEAEMAPPFEGYCDDVVWA